jgi:ketosteroid isomerase-like protein
MHANKFLLSAAFCLATVACCTQLRADDAQADETQAVEQASNKFYEGLNALFTGDSQPIQNVWSHADDVTLLGPAGGIVVGWDAIRAQWEHQSGLKLGGKIEPADLHIVVTRDLAIAQCYERGENLDAQGQAIPVSIRATNVFRKENGQWKLISHHTDLLPFLDQETRTKAAE